MKVKDVKVGTILTMIGGSEYVVTSIEGDEIRLEHITLDAGCDIYLEDLPEMFEDIESYEQLKRQ